MNYNEYLKNQRGYQEVGHLLLLERKHACLFYKPGKGKTYPCIDAIRDIDKAKGGKARVLILSTADAIRNMWNVDIVPQNILPKDTVLMTFNSAIIEATKAKLMRVKWDVLVIDESHKIKSHNSKTSKLVYMLSKRTEYVFGLTGTPRGNSDLDIFCQFHNMCIGEWGAITYTQFVNQCCDLDTQFFRGQAIKIPIGINKRYQAGWEANIAKFTQRVDYDEEDEMPDLKVNLIELPYVATKEYLQAERGVIELSDYESTLNKLSAVQKLHQIVNGFVYIPDETDYTCTKRKIVDIEHNKKLDWIEQNITNEPTVIVYRFEADFNNIVSMLDTNNIKYTDNVDDFKAGKARVLMLQCARCESFNLQMCNRIIFYTLDYSYIKYNQMLHRVWRMGQENDVQIDVLIFKDTVESKIWNAVRNKEKFAELFMSIKGV